MRDGTSLERPFARLSWKTAARFSRAGRILGSQDASTEISRRTDPGDNSLEKGAGYKSPPSDRAGESSSVDSSAISGGAERRPAAAGRNCPRHYHRPGTTGARRTYISAFSDGTSRDYRFTDSNPARAV